MESHSEKKSEPSAAGGVCVAITGGIACGKSEAGRILAGEGVAICEADKLAHDLLARGCPTGEAVVARFGDGILASDGTIDRARLGRLVFGDAGVRAALNAIVHPPAIERIARWREEMRGRKAAAVVPLLFEVGMTDGWDAVLCVGASERTAIDRMRARGLSEAEARARIAAQMPLEEKKRLADYTIENDGDLESLRRQVRGIWKRICERKETRT